MSRLPLKVYVAACSLIDREEAQNLVEYGLVVCLIAVVCIAGIGNLATAIGAVFNNIDKKLF